MKNTFWAAAILFLLCGCAQTCEFGRGGDKSGFKCYGSFDQAKLGMTQKEVEQKIGVPQKRKFGISYRGKPYDEAWVYESSPPTVLYFNNGILERKEY
jgi:hypothetical protein